MKSTCTLLVSGLHTPTMTSSESCWSVHFEEKACDPKPTHKGDSQKTLHEEPGTSTNMNSVTSSGQLKNQDRSRGMSKSQPGQKGEIFVYRSEIVANITPVIGDRSDVPDASTNEKTTKPLQTSASKLSQGNDTMPTFSDTIHQGRRSESSSSSSSSTPEAEQFYDPIPERPYSRSHKPWRVNSHWSPVTGRLFEPLPTEYLSRGTWAHHFGESDIRKARRPSFTDFRSHFFGPSKLWNDRPARRDRNRSLEPRGTGPWDSEELFRPLPKKASQSRSPRVFSRNHSRNRSINPSINNRADTAVGIDLSTSLCLNCGLSRLHLQDVCLYCKQRRGNSTAVSYPSTRRPSKEFDKTEFLQAAAVGLGELAHLSSDEEMRAVLSPKGVQSANSNNYSVPVTMPVTVNNHENNRVAMNPLDLTPPNQKEATAVTKVDNPRTPSHSGSSMSESGKRQMSGTCHRPKLPARLKEYQERDTTGDVQHSAAAESATGADKTIEKLVAQLEVRSVQSEMPDQNARVTTIDSPSGNPSQIDHENFKALKRDDGVSTGVNKQLKKLIHQRNITGPSNGLNGSTLKPSEGTTPSSARSQSQQPTQRSNLEVEQSNAQFPHEGSSVRPKTPGPKPTYDTLRTYSGGKISTPSGYDRAKAPQSPASSSSGSARSSHRPANQSQNDQNKSIGRLTLSRRLAYDPHASVTASKDTSAVRTHRNSQATPMNGGSNRGVRRRTTGGTRTAPVEKSDCLAALEIIQAQGKHAKHLSTTQKPFRRETPGDPQSARHDELLSSTNDKVISGNEEPFRTRSSRSSSTQVRNAVSPVNKARTQRNGAARMIQREIFLPAGSKCSTATTSKADRPSNRSASQAAYRTNERDYMNGAPNITEKPDLLNACQDINNEKPYPDLAVESVRYKIEKLTDFIVRLRKRIELDYAEKGTCSPGDDIFGDEAVGAVVNGQSTGMHPVVSSSLKNLRIIEFNVQDIFSLLYPSEVDLWEPAIACLSGAVRDEIGYNEAKGKVTEQISAVLQLKNELDSSKSPSKSPTQISKKLGDYSELAHPYMGSDCTSGRDIEGV